MTAKAEGEEAIKELDGVPLKGREIKVNEARPREGRPRVVSRRAYFGD